MDYLVQFIIQGLIGLVTLGAFYGATLVEIRWIKETLVKHDKKLDKINEKIYTNNS